MKWPKECERCGGSGKVWRRSGYYESTMWGEPCLTHRGESGATCEDTGEPIEHGYLIDCPACAGVLKAPHEAGALKDPPTAREFWLCKVCGQFSQTKGAMIFSACMSPCDMKNHQLIKVREVLEDEE